MKIEIINNEFFYSKITSDKWVIYLSEEELKNFKKLILSDKLKDQSENVEVLKGNTGSFFVIRYKDGSHKSVYYTKEETDELKNLLINMTEL